MKTLITTSLSVILVLTGLSTMSSCKADRVDPEYDLGWDKIPAKNIALVDIDEDLNEFPIEDFFNRVGAYASGSHFISFVTNDDRTLDLHWDSPEGFDNIALGTFKISPYGYNFGGGSIISNVTGAVRITEFAPLSDWNERDTREIMIKGTFHLKNKLPDGTIHNYKCAFYYEGTQWEYLECV